MKFAIHRITLFLRSPTDIQCMLPHREIKEGFIEWVQAATGGETSKVLTDGLANLFHKSVHGTRTPGVDD